MSPFFKYIPFFLCPFWLSRRLTLNFGGKSKSYTNQETDQSTNINLTNQQVGASEGSIAAGAGANQDINSGIQIEGSSGVTFENVDDEIINAAADAIETAGQANRDALIFSEKVVSDTLAGIADGQANANDLVRQTNEVLAGVVGDKAEDATSTQAAKFQRTLLIAGALTAAAYLANSYIKKK
jgi:hypothetical protein